MSDQLTVAQLNQPLNDLVYWEKFALHLEGISPTDIGIIKREHPQNINNQRIALYEKWLDKCTTATWGKVIMALETVDEKRIAQKITVELPVSSMKEVSISSNTVQKLSDMKTSFSKITYSCEQLFKTSKKVTLDELISRVKHELRPHYADQLNKVTNINSFFDFVRFHYHFFDCHLLVVLVEEFFQPCELLDKLLAQVQNVRSFVESVKIRALSEQLSCFIIKSPHEVPVTVRVYNAWEENRLQTIQILLKALFHLDHDDLMKFFRVIEGSLLLIAVLVPHHITMSLITHSKCMLQFMRLTGIISLQVGETYILQDEENSNYTFENGLMESVEASNYEAVMFLLEQGCVSINSTTITEQVNTEHSHTESEALTQVAQASTANEPTINKQIDKKCDHTNIIKQDINGNIQFTRDEGTTALMLACCNDDTDMVKLLLENTANPNLQTKTGWTALIYAVMLGNTRIVNMLMKYGADVNMKKHSNRATALIYACATGNVKIVATLLKHSADPNLQDNNRITPLFVASQNGHLKVAERLLQAKINPDSQKDDGRTPLFIASQNGHFEVVERLLRAKVNPDAPMEDGATPLFIASQNGRLKVVERLLQAKVNPDTPADNGVTPLYIASAKGHLEVVERLIQAKANPDAHTADDGATPLCIASQNGHLEVVERLLQAKVDPDVPMEDGATPLFIACQNGHLEVVERLLQAKVNPDIPADNGVTPLYISSAKGHLKVVERLLQAKANQDSPADDGTTSLYIASAKGHLEVVKKLLQTKVNPDTPGDDGKAPLFIASEKGPVGSS